jgi:hypothetical protein
VAGPLSGNWVRSALHWGCGCVQLPRYKARACAARYPACTEVGLVLSLRPGPYGGLAEVGRPQPLSPCRLTRPAP